MTMANWNEMKRLFLGILIFTVMSDSMGPLRSSSFGDDSQGKIGLNIGNMAPDFVLPDILGKTVRLSAFKGKRVILNFWSTWCKPCIEELPDMQTFYKENQSTGIEILAVSINRERDSTVKDFAERLNLTFPVLCDFDKVVARRYRVYVLPTSFLINENGVIREKWYGKIDLGKVASMEQIRKTEAVSPEPQK